MRYLGDYSESVAIWVSWRGRGGDLGEYSQNVMIWRRWQKNCVDPVFIPTIDEFIFVSSQIMKMETTHARTDAEIARARACVWVDVVVDGRVRMREHTT